MNYAPRRIIELFVEFQFFFACMQKTRCGGGPESIGPPKTEDFSGNISVGAVFNQSLQGIQQEWTIRLKPGAGRRIELLFIDFFASEKRPCDSDAGPYVKIELLDSPKNNYFISSSVPVKTKSDYLICGSVQDLNERVWLLNASAVKIIFRHLASAKARLFVGYRGVHEAQRAKYCSHEKGDNSGLFKTTIESGYSPLTFCTALLEVEKGTQMMITIKDVTLEYSGVNCEYDKLILFNGLSENAPVLGRYCGLFNDIVLYPQSYQVFVVFESDTTLTAGGFEILYNTTAKSKTLKTITGVVKFPEKPAGTIACSTGKSCFPSFELDENRIFVWELSVPIGHDIDISWNATAYSESRNESNGTGFELKIYGGTNLVSHENEDLLLLSDVTAGDRHFRASSLTIRMTLLPAVHVNQLINYKSRYRLDVLPSECKSPVNRQVVVTKLYTELVLTVTRQIVNCVWVFRASNQRNFVKLTIDKMPYIDNDCNTAGYAVYDGDAPDNQYKRRGPFCRPFDPITIFSTQEYMTVVFYVNKITEENINIRAFVSETDCIPVYSDSPNAVDLSRRSCFVLLDFPQQLSDGTIQRTFPVANLTHPAQLQTKESRGYNCEVKTGCLQVYTQPSPLLPVCNYQRLQKLPEIISSCPGALQTTQLVFNVQNVFNPLSEHCVEFECNDKETGVISRTCGTFSLLRHSTESAGKCRLLLSRKDQNCQSNRTDTFSQYKLRFASGGAHIRAPSVKEKIFEIPCGNKYSEKSYLIDRKYSDMNIIYTVSSDFVEIQIDRKDWFSLQFELVEIEAPFVRVSPTYCPNKDYFLSDRGCYSLQQFRTVEPGTWGHAQRKCQKDGAQLVSIPDENELTFLKKMLASYWRVTAFQKRYILVYIGLKGQGGDGTWMDGTQVRLTDWHRRLYSDKITEDEANFMPPEEISAVIPSNRLQPIREEYSLCTVMYISEPSVRLQYETNWAKLPCNYPFPEALFVCKKSPYRFSSSTAEPDAGVTLMPTNRCTRDWTFMNGACVKLVTSLHSLTTSLSYTDAKSMCIQMGARMANISDNDLAYIRYLLSLWRHQPEYRGIWFEKINTTCRVMNAHKNTWKSLEFQLDAIRENVVEYDIIEFDCNTKPPFTWSITPLNSETKNYAKYQDRKTLFPNGPLSVLCERDIISHSTRCGAHQHTCKDGTCIFEAQLCDGNLDCLGGDDEETCGCENTFRCNSGECLPYSLYCDHVNHCKDRSDETNCTYPSCSVGEFRCADGACIEMNRTCDLIKDCRSVEDESAEQCDWAASCINGFHCYSATCIPKPRQNDLQADCPTFTAEDEVLKYEDSIRGEVVVGGGAKPTVAVNYTSFCPKSDEVRCIPQHSKCFKRGNACVYDIDKYLFPAVVGCRDFSHLTNCSRFECPGMFKCPNSFCIHIRRVCDGTADCVYGEDEVGCKKYSCPGLLRCPGQQICIEQHLICDGKVDCANGDDEKYCDLPSGCPGSCSCNDFSMDCFNVSLTSIPTYSKNLRALLFSYNMLELTRNTFSGYYYMGVLDISYNNLTTIPEYAFQGLDNLLRLNLKGNRITHLTQYAFGGINIQRIDLSANKLVSISSYAFEGRLRILNIEDNDRNLKIDLDAFSKVLIDIIYTDAYTFCCALNTSVECFPEPGEFSSCEDLLADEFLRYAIWVIGMMAFVGNIAVFFWRLKTERQNVNSFLILNLSVSDFIMGVYLLIIASADQYFESQGRFYQYEQDWREGFLCQFEGFISTVACEMSVFTLVVITVDRVLVLVFTFQVNSLSRKAAALVEGVGWVTCCVIAAVPLIMYGDIYYGSTSVCLPFTLRNTSSTGWMYSASVFIGFNLLCFIVIAGGYIWIYVYVRQQRLNSKRKSTARDLALARRLVLIVLTDFCCWVPISVIGIVALSGVTISRQISAWVAVFIMPINSALNPLLYTFSSANFEVCCPSQHSERSADINSKPLKNKRVNDFPSSHTVDTPLPTPHNLRRLLPETPKSARTLLKKQYENKAFALEEPDAKENGSISPNEITLADRRVSHNETTQDDGLELQNLKTNGIKTLQTVQDGETRNSVGENAIAVHGESKNTVRHHVKVCPSGSDKSSTEKQMDSCENVSRISVRDEIVADGYDHMTTSNYEETGIRCDANKRSVISIR